ncbi:M1 family peptidase [Actinomadura logoneensis]|uniref:Aminopeptidase N n=1 Tax=Actinomadura logoneensis TaxID=2293572 RepID=A0A372JB18_9ACTN|nr:M1 family metallopeptidase [Actinomadura logoneensis]RFU36588.1 M1 family peptidase [Actinomadura logoneensis]
MARRSPRLVPTVRTPGRLLPLALAAVTAVAFAPAASAASPTRFTPGAEGVGDSYFPLEGNGGYDALHYSLRLAYDTDYGQLDGTVTMTARATRNLSSFDLDLSGMDVAKVVVDGQRASFHRRGQELKIKPRHGLRKGSSFRVAVTYGGVPQTIVGSPIVFGSPYGFLKTPDGAFIGDEPNGASTWFPVNDHPSDKATYDFTVTVPKGLTVVANGLPAGRSEGMASFSRREAATRAGTFRWRENKPMASYLATIDIGKWDVKQSKTPGGLNNYVAVDPVLETSQPNAVQFFTDTTAEATDLWAKTWGPYPFETTGAIADNAVYNGKPLGFSLETQSKPVYSAVRSTSTIAHELAHQWFGDSVSVARWKDIWLNESFASWSAYYWTEKHGGATVHDRVRTIYNSYPFPDKPDDPYWSVKIADPQRDTMFNDRVYSGGATVLQLLREKIGDDKFFTLLRTWAAAHRYGNATTEQFVALANKVSGQDLNPFFQTWIYSTGKPPLP